MTTIAYKDGVIAYDSRLTAGSYIDDDNYDKKIEIDGIIIFISGEICEKNIDNFVKCYRGDVESKTSIQAIVFDDGNLYECSYNDDYGFYKFKLNKDKHYAVGSGSYFAIAAMDMGATAEQAVKQAIKRDSYSGGAINLFKVTS